MKRNVFLPIVFCSYILILALFFVIMPKKDFSENEKRVLATLNNPTFEEIVDGTFTEELENYLPDRFPFRDTFVGINSYYELASTFSGANGVYFAKNGHLIAKPKSFSPQKIKSNCDAISSFIGATGLDATLMIVPSPGYALDDLLPPLHEVYGDDTVLNIACASCTNAEIIDTFGILCDNEDMYYKTDHHLTSKGSLALYNAYCMSKSITPHEFTLSKTCDGFFGTAYSTGGFWLSVPDTVEIYKSEASFSVRINDGTSQKTSDSLYFESHLNNMDKYPVFLDGNHAVVSIHNNDISNSKRLMIIKDSYAHCAATFLAEEYEDICMIDLRYYRGSLKKLVKEIGTTDLLFFYGAENLATSTDIPRLKL